MKNKRNGAGETAGTKSFGWWLYGLKIKLFPPRKTNKGVSAKKQKFGRNVFVFLMLLFPLAQFCVFYIGVNLNSILLSFKAYDALSGTYHYIGFGNFALFIERMKVDFGVQSANLNSFIFYGLNMIVLLPVQVLAAYYVYKKFAGHVLFEIFLFLPSIISSIVLSVIYKYFVDGALLDFLNSIHIENLPGSFFTDSAHNMMTIIVFNIWTLIGSNIILNTGAMARIPTSIIEFGELEGITPMKEFMHVILPLIFPTISVYIITGVAAIFTNQAGLYNFYGGDAPKSLYTYGYYIFTQVIGEEAATLSQYPYASAAGLLFSVIVIPITLTVKFLLEKFGPSAEF